MRGRPTGSPVPNSLGCDKTRGSRMGCGGQRQGSKLIRAVFLRMQSRPARRIVILRSEAMKEPRFCFT